MATMLKVYSSIHNGGNDDGDDGDDHDRACPQPVERGRVFGKRAKQNSRCGNSPGHKVRLSKSISLSRTFTSPQCISSPTFECRRGLLLERRLFYPPHQKKDFFMEDFYFSLLYI